MLDLYRRDYADFHAAAMREYYLFLSGQKTTLELARIYDRYSDLFSTDAISRLKQTLEETSEHYETEKEGARRLLAFATEQFMEASVKELTEQISEYEAAATVECAGRRMTFQDTSVAIATEPDRRARLAIYKERLAVIASSNDLRAERLARLHQTAASLGYANYRGLYEGLRRVDYDSVAREAEAMLSRTESAYFARLADALKRDLGIRVEDAERPDAMYFLHLTAYDDRFPADKLLDVYGDTMEGLGISARAQKNILIDSEPRPHKSSRAFCIAVSVPEDVRLVIRPVGGQSDYQALLHEGGHAQHYGWASALLRPEFKYTGDYALTETYAFLFNHLVSDAAWLDQLLSFRDSANFINSVMLARLVVIRRYAAKLIYELKLHAGGGLAESAESYSELQTAATRFRTGPTESLYDLDDGFYSASYLRAWAFEVMLREHLKSRFGQRWWASRRAGSYLKEMWETGDRYTADEMASQIGIGPISFDPLTDEFNRALK
jgi:oligoendopeptidase F